MRTVSTARNTRGSSQQPAGASGAMLHASVLTVMIWAWALSSAQAQPTTAPDQPTVLTESQRLVDRADERVSVLGNGLTVLLKVHRTAPVVTVRMYCRTGSIYEQEYLGAGMSHLFEHLLHGGATTTRSEEESRRILDEIGGNTNAYTSYDVTCYFINTGREHTARAVELLSDWITHPTFPQEAFDREWGVVQRELERDVDDPDRQLFQLTMETMYLVHPARYPVIGHKPIVQALKKEDIVGYYQRMYVPDNIVVTIAGDIDLDEVLGVICRQFASFERRRMPTIVLPEEPEMTTPRFATKRMKVQAAVLQLAWPSIPLIHPDLYALDVLSYILTEGDSSRLALAIRDKGLSYTIDSFSWTPEWRLGMFTLMARLDPAQLQATKEAILEQVRLLQEQPVTPAELEKAKQQKAAEHVFDSQTAESVGSTMASDFLSSGDPHFSRDYVEKIQKLTPEAIREVARRYLVPDRLATISILPEGYESPTSGQEKPAEPQPVRKFVLDNGLRCLIRSDPTTPLVALQSFSLGGALFEDKSTNGLSGLAAYLSLRGTKTRTAQEIASFFDSRGGTIAASSGNNTVFTQAEVLKADFEEAIDVFADVVCQPVFPADELEIYRPQLLDSIRSTNESWRNELFAYASTKFYRHSPYGLDVLDSAKVVSKADREQVEKMWERTVTGPDTVVAIYGDVDADKAEALVRKHFSGLPKRDAAIPDITPEPKPAAPQLYIRRKSPERRVAGISLGYRGLTVTDRDDRPAVAAMDTIISGYRYPTGWLHDSLRGGNRDFVYEVHAMSRPGVLPGVFQIYAACEPSRVSEVYRIINEQLNKARAGNFTAAELDRAKSIIVTSELMDRQTNSARAMDAAMNELYGLGDGYTDEFLRQVQSVALEEVKRVAVKYLTTPIVVVVTPDPEKVQLGFPPVAIEDDPSIAVQAAEGTP